MPNADGKVRGATSEAAAAVPAPASLVAHRAGTGSIMALLGSLAMLLPTAGVSAFLLQSQRERESPAAVGLHVDPIKVPSVERRIRGRVLDAEGIAVPQVSVQFISAATSATTTTDARGQFGFELPAIQHFRIRAQRADCGSVESAELDASPAGSLVLVLPPMTTLTGRITDARGNAVPRALAKLVGNDSSGDRLTVADGDGRYAFACVAPGPRRLTMWARGFSPATIDVDVGSSGVDRDARLRPAPPVRGVVVDPSGRPVTFARVTACSGKQREEALSDEQGNFELPPLTVGCSIRAHHPRFAASRPVVIAAGRALSVRLEPGGAFEARVTDARNRPIGAFSVTLTAFDPALGELSESRIGETHSELRGAFHWDELAPGTYGITVEADDLAPWSSTIRVESGKVARGLHVILGETSEGAPSVEPPQTDGDADSDGEPAGETSDDAPESTADGEESKSDEADKSTESDEGTAEATEERSTERGAMREEEVRGKE
jgi:hypothetical protein